MSGATIAAEVAQALSDVARDVGTGEFLVTLIKAPANPQTPWDTGYYGEAQEFALPAIIQEYPRSMIDGALIQMGDRRIMMSARDQRPDTGDKLKVLDTVYRVMMIKEVGPSGVALYYEVQARV